MRETFKAKLWVDGVAVELNPFVEQILSGTVAGAVKSLKDTEGMKQVDIQVDKGETGIRVNGKEIPLTPFPNDIITNILTGFTSSLKGVSSVETIKILMESS